MDTDRSEFDSDGDAERWEALARYYAGESDAAEAKAIEAWLADRPEQSSALSALDGAIARLATSSAPALDADAALAAAKARSVDVGVRGIRPLPPAKRESNPWRLAALAAAAVIVVAAGVVLRQPGRTGPSAPTLIPAQVFTTTFGKRDSVRLTDSTRVVLGPGSQLSIAAGYGTLHREVALRGVAFFDVAHNSEEPAFIVRVPGAVVQDIGTAFVVRGDSGQPARVTVTNGAVNIWAANDSAHRVRLGASDVGVVDARGVATAFPATAGESDIAWRSGTLVFDGASLTEVRDALRRWFGADLRFDPDLASRHVSASFKQEPLIHVVSVLAQTLGLRAEQSGTVITLRRAPPLPSPK